MKTRIILLPTGEAVLASSITCVRKADYIPVSILYKEPIKARVIVGAGDSTLVLFCDTHEERDALAERIITEWREALNQ
jgi:hypothetical protein